jgi:hypothetical protein
MIISTEVNLPAGAFSPPILRVPLINFQNLQPVIKYDIHLYRSYLSAFFVSAGVPNGEFQEIFIAKCRSILCYIVLILPYPDLLLCS